MESSHPCPSPGGQPLPPLCASPLPSRNQLRWRTGLYRDPHRISTPQLRTSSPALRGGASSADDKGWGEKQQSATSSRREKRTRLPRISRLRGDALASTSRLAHNASAYCSNIDQAICDLPWTRLHSLEWLCGVSFGETCSSETKPSQGSFISFAVRASREFTVNCGPPCHGLVAALQVARWPHLTYAG